MKFKMPLLIAFGVILIGAFAFFAFSLPKPMLHFPTKEILSYSVSPCNEGQEFKEGIREDTFEQSLSDSALTINQNLKYVCCADVKVFSETLDFGSHKLIKITEKNLGSVCKCICDYDLNITLSNLAKGDYTVQVYGVEYQAQKGDLKWEQNFTVSSESTTIANPASVNCINKGGTLDIRTDDTGGQYGVCVFKDGAECEEWAYFRGECTPVKKQFCDAETSCPDGQECYKFQDESTPICWTGDPCSRCQSGKCMAATSYPPQISCQ